MVTSASKEPEARLRVALIVVGAAFVVGIYPMMIVWQAGFRWQPAHSAYEQMIIVIYAALGVFLIRASRTPLANLSLIWFTVWSSVAHSAVMTVHAVADPSEWTHAIADIPLLLIAAATLALFTISATKSAEPTTTRCGTTATTWSSRHDGDRAVTRCARRVGPLSYMRPPDSDSSTGFDARRDRLPLRISPGRLRLRRFVQPG
ncbi:DUF6632 domain-containing protein [Nocardia nova]|uniref:DUF6632 domain-containing protein n=1 Tax=Nocardia nova TaxID=37330 RepID=UPI00379FF7C7